MSVNTSPPTVKEDPSNGATDHRHPDRRYRRRQSRETVVFGLDGKQYEIDLGAKNAKNLRKAIAAYVEAGRKVKTAAVPRGATRRRPVRQTARI